VTGCCWGCDECAAMTFGRPLLVSSDIR
jgi:hypothetical protein